MPADEELPPLVLAPIGVVRTALGTKAEAPRQPRAAATGAGVIELLPGRNFEHALEDLADWEMIWVIFWFHLNPGWRPKVLPPRSRSGRKGVFATRAPHRPNPIGLSAVRLERVAGLAVHVSGADMVDGTPVLDLKPYVPYTDAHPQAASGWLDAAAQAGAAPADPVPAFEVVLEPLAAAQAAWVEERTGFPLAARVAATLSVGPQPHPYRRIRRDGDGLRLAVQAWRVRFTVEGRRVRVLAVASGYRPRELAAPDAGRRAELAVHRDFAAAWPGPASAGLT
jgi:tRNA-Thr(GGU) m(6)t(6)A37 methyltransferase TsaA